MSSTRVIVFTRRSSIGSVNSENMHTNIKNEAMGLDAMSLNSSNARSRRPRSRSRSRPSIRGASIGTRSINSIEAPPKRRPINIIEAPPKRKSSNESLKRRRRMSMTPKISESSSDGDGTKQIMAFHQQRRRSSMPMSMRMNSDDALENGKTEHASNLTDALGNGKTEHTSNLRYTPRKKDSKYNSCESTAPSSDAFDEEDEETAAGEEQSCTQTVETRESRFQSLLSQWKTREKEGWKTRDEKEQKERRAPVQKPKTLYLEEDENRSCFEGVLKHWKKQEVTRTKSSESKNSIDSLVNGDAEVFFDDDDQSDVSSLGNSIRQRDLQWGYESDSRFDFAFDARFDEAIPASPRSPAKQKKKVSLSSKKRDESRSPKKKRKSKKKTDDASFATFEAANDAAMDASVASSIATYDTKSSKKKKKIKKKKKKSKSSDDNTLDGSIATMEDSIATQDTSDSKSSKKKKRKSRRSSKIKKPKTPLKSPKKKLIKNISREGSESTAKTESSPLSDEEGSKGAYLPGWLSPPPESPKKVAKKRNSVEKKEKEISPVQNFVEKKHEENTPVVEKKDEDKEEVSPVKTDEPDEIPFVPDLEIGESVRSFY